MTELILSALDRPPSSLWVALPPEGPGTSSRLPMPTTRSVKEIATAAADAVAMV